MLAGDGKALGRGQAEGEGCGAGQGQNRELRWRQNAFSPRRGAWCPPGQSNPADLPQNASSSVSPIGSQIPPRWTAVTSSSLSSSYRVPKLLFLFLP